VGLSDVDIAQARVKRAMLREALTRTGGNFTKAADLLGAGITTMFGSLSPTTAGSMLRHIFD
jgi:DNA-binding NtrC family response regulator